MLTLYPSTVIVMDTCRNANTASGGYPPNNVKEFFLAFRGLLACISIPPERFCFFLLLFFRCAGRGGYVV